MTEAKDLRPGNYIKINNEVQRVTRKEVVSCGTHCHSKTKLFIQGLFSKGEKSINLNHHDKVEMVDITRKEGQVIAKLPGKVQVMDSVSYETVDAEAETGLLEELNEGDTVTFVSFEGKSKIIEKRQ